MFAGAGGAGVAGGAGARVAAGVGAAALSGAQSHRAVSRAATGAYGPTHGTILSSTSFPTPYNVTGVLLCSTSA